MLLFVNNVLQNFFALVAYGSSLNLDPLVMLLVTTAAGLVGGVSLTVLVAPLTAVISRTARRLGEARQTPYPDRDLHRHPPDLDLRSPRVVDTEPGTSGAGATGDQRPGLAGA